MSPCVHFTSKCYLVPLGGAYYIVPIYFSGDGYLNHPDYFQVITNKATINILIMSPHRSM